MTDWFKPDNKKVKMSWRMNIPKEWKKKKVRQRDIKDIEISSIMTVPNTKDGELLTRLVQKKPNFAN